MERHTLFVIGLLVAAPLSAEPQAGSPAGPAMNSPAPAVDVPPPGLPEKRGPALDAIKPIRITGQVVEVRDDVIVLQKGKERWEVARHAGTRIKGEIRKGARVTVDFRAVAASIEVRDEKIR